MHRRHLLAAVGTGLAASVAGCSDAPDSTPTPQESILRLSVANSTDTTHSIDAVLRVTAEELTRVEAFQLADIEAGATRTRDPQLLDAGEYELELDLPLGMETTVTWEGHDCPEKEVEIELLDDGFRRRTDCIQA